MAPMTPIEIVLLVGLAVVIGLQWMNGRKKADVNVVDVAPLKEKIGELQAQLESEKSERNKLVGQNKQMYAEQLSLKEEVKSLKKDNADLEKKVSKYEASDDRREEQIATRIQQLDAAKDALEDEKIRVRQEDEERLRIAEEERDRIWNDHENAVIAQLTSLCKLPQLAFAHYTNTNLPDDFISLKPDFMIEFLDQYIIFDAKASKAESLQTYITNAVKTTASKVKKNPKIASMIFLVVPSEAISELKSFVYPVDGYTVYVVSPEALSPILSSLKRITTYEFADQMDPQQRENIVQLIAELDFHINLRNAADILLTKQGAQILEKAQLMDPELAEEVAMKKQPMNAKASIAATELKKIVSNLTMQNIEVQQLVSPKSAVRKKDLAIAEKLINESIL
jgi:hypothetical protein